MRPTEVTVDVFDWQMRLMAASFNVLPLVEAWERLDSGTLPPRAACITFDDGYSDNANIAAPVLRHYGLPATFFIASGFLNGGRMWNDTVIEVVRRLRPDQFDFSFLGLGVEEGGTPQKRCESAGSLCAKLKHMDYDRRRDCVAALEALVPEALPSDLMMTDRQVRELRDAGMGIGAHTVSHPILAKLDDERCRAEIGESKAALEEIIGRNVDQFAYPNGKRGRDYEPRHVEMVRQAGFSVAVSTHRGVADSSSDRFELPRFTPWHRKPEKFHLSLAMNYFSPAPGGV